MSYSTTTSPISSGGNDRAAAIAVAAGFGAATAKPVDIVPETAPAALHFLVPAGYTPTTVDLEKYRAQPTRKKGHPQFTEADSFVRYVNAHKTDGTALYADVTATQIIAILDGHASKGPGWEQHKATLKLAHTKAWLRWTNASGLNGLMGQERFAEFIEDSIEDIVSPDAATLIEMARSFEATTNVRFKSAVRATDGQRQLTYEETTESTSGAQGSIEIPDVLTLAIPVFEGATARDRIVAKFRYRLGGGKVTLGFELDRPDDVIRAAWGDILGEVENGIVDPEDGEIIRPGTGITPYAGKPSA